MNDYIYSRCTKLLNKLESKPMTQLIKNEWACSIGHLTFDKIKEKHENHLYASLFDLYIDLCLLLQPKDQHNTSFSFVNVVLEDIYQWVTNKVQNMPRSKEEEDYMKLHKYIEKIRYIFHAMIINVDIAQPDVPADQAAANRQISTQAMQATAGHKRIEVLQQRIEHLRTPDELQTVLKILQKHIRHFNLSPEVVIEGRYITKACANELRDFLNSVNA